MDTPSSEAMEETDSATLSKRSLLAEEHRYEPHPLILVNSRLLNESLYHHRKRMMTQIAEMQKKFFDDHKDELELIENTHKLERE